jgi:hypothetical protein
VTIYVLFRMFFSWCGEAIPLFVVFGWRHFRHAQGDATVDSSAQFGLILLALKQ